MIINILCSHISLFPQRRRKSAQRETETDPSSCQDPSESCQLPSASQPQALLLLLAIISPFKLSPKPGKFGFLSGFQYKCCSEIHQSLLLATWDHSAALSGTSGCLFFIGFRLNLLRGNSFCNFSSWRTNQNFSQSLANVTSWKGLQHIEIQAGEQESLGSWGSAIPPAGDQHQHSKFSLQKKTETGWR